MEALHRILSGQSLNEHQLKWAGRVVMLWMGMDLIEFIDMIIGWFK